MQLHQLKPFHKRIRYKRIGRGGKKGASSGWGIGKRGTSQPRIREVLKRYPKMRGTRARRNPLAYEEVNLTALEKKFASGETVNPETLAKYNMVKHIKGRIPAVKILGNGELTKSLIIERCKVSKGAKAKIEKVGGTIR